MPRYAAAADREKRRGVTVYSAAPQPQGISEGRIGTGNSGGEGRFAAQSCDPERFRRGRSFGGTRAQQRNDRRLPGAALHIDQPSLLQRRAGALGPGGAGSAPPTCGGPSPASERLGGWEGRVHGGPLPTETYSRQSMERVVGSVQVGLQDRPVHLVGDAQVCGCRIPR